ncbi:hypothetical protein QUF58_05215 [Anaerolineales bacterium HSG24]|nr:hypothetical protein [Anaerolineales bacterium HSG24]
MVNKFLSLLRSLIFAVIASLLMMVGLAEVTFAMPSQPQSVTHQLQVITGTKTAMPTNSVLAGEVITYTIVFSSDTTFTQVITDAVPEYTTYQPDSVGCTPIISFSLCTIQLDNRTLQWQPTKISSVPVTLTFAVKVDDPITSGLTIVNQIKLDDTMLQQVNTVTSQPALQVTIQTDKRQAAIDEQIQYTYTITNIGNELLTDLSLTDTRFNRISLPLTSLIAGQMVSTTVTYTMQLSDYPGPVINSVQGQAVSAVSGSNINSNIDNVAVTIDNSPSIAVFVAATPTLAYVGETITYHYFVTNTGNITLTDVIVTDDRFGSIEVASMIDPQEVVTQTATYIAQSTDLPVIPNQVTASCEGLLGKITSAQSGARVEITGTAIISMAIVPSQATVHVNDLLIYTYFITNMGQMTVTDVTLVGTQGQIISLPTTILAPQASLVASEPYTVRETDLPGPLIKHVTSTAKSVVGSTKASALSTMSIASNPEIRLSVTADPTTASLHTKIRYSYVITNIGDVTLPDVTVTDSRFGTIPLPDKLLFPGDSLTGQATHQVNIADFSSPMLNLVTATATTAAGLFTDYATVTVTLQANPALTLTISISISPDKTNTFVGDTVQYQYHIRNIGDIPLTRLSLTDSRLGEITVPLDWDRLRPQESVKTTKNYTIQPADAGLLTNVATTTGLFLEQTYITTGQTSLKVSTKSYLPVIMKNVITPLPELQLEVFVEPTEAFLYETVYFTYIVTNTGNVPIHYLSLEDEWGEVGLEKITLEPDEFIEKIQLYQIERDDLFELVNEVTVTGIYEDKDIRLRANNMPNQVPPTPVPGTVIELIKSEVVWVTIPTTELYVESEDTGDIFITFTKIPEGWVYSCSIKNDQTMPCVNFHPSNYFIEVEMQCGHFSREKTFFERDESTPYLLFCR